MRFIFLTFFTLTLYAQEYNFLHQTALETAAKERKLLMLLIVQDHCPWCQKFAFKVLKTPEISKAVQKNFCPLLVNKDKLTLPKKYHIHSTPTIYFINPSEEEEVWMSVGYKNKVELLEVFKKAIQSYQEDLEDEKR